MFQPPTVVSNGIKMPVVNFTYNATYVFIYFKNSGCNSTNSKTAEYTIQYMHTWILKDECVATYIAPIEQKMHLINTKSVNSII